MRRRAAKVDDNQASIVDCLRRAGVEVRVMSAVGEGFPDLLTLYKGVLRLIEIKDGAKPPSAQKLTNVQQAMALVWPIVVVRDEREALEAHGIEVVVDTAGTLLGRIEERKQRVIAATETYLKKNGKKGWAE